MLSRTKTRDSTRQINKILIANRGEIAVRIIRACKESGIRSVAVYSEADARAMHVRMADEAYCIGEPPPLKSYLDQDKIINVAKESHADAIHPGYGFLSENAIFAKRVKDEGFIFIGPPPEAMHLLGDKTSARTLAKKIGVPTVPGTIDSILSILEAKNIAQEIGFPVLIKAAAGGGGKGMRVVETEKEFQNAALSAQREAQNAFGDGRVFIEKYLHHPKHIEFQILADNYGNVVHLGERECSIQRRHQKIIEESPSMALTPELRQRMGETACNLIRTAGYTNAGTVEFLLDSDNNFYFLEVNARLQVEHPVTEMTTGIDLVREQIALAEGVPLRLSQSDIVQNGWAIECRIIAEDTMNNFMPSIGTIMTTELPQGIGVRNDSVIESGYNVLPYYDSLIGKLICHGDTREHAIQRTIRALNEYFIAGISTSIPFCNYAIEHESFRNGTYNTGFVEIYVTAESLVIPEEIRLIAAAVGSYVYANESIKIIQNKSNKWKLHLRDYGL